MILNSVNYPEDIKKLNISQLEELASDIRELIVESVMNNGGHLSANLGVVELTIALHYVFDIPQDKLIFDVGHQCYTHKILTGRKDLFKSLRKKDGISGFPKTQESKYDCANSGHASTSLAISNGLAAAAAKDDTSKIITLLGDGAMTGGLSFEALNNFKNTDNNNRIIILNDNDMAISKNVGFINNYLKQVKYNGESSFFENLGIDYYGVVDGHNLDHLIKAFTYAKNCGKSLIVHVATIKGRGFALAEKNPMSYHGYPIHKVNTVCFSDFVGEKLFTLAAENPNIIAVTAAMTDGTGLGNFSKTYPNRFYDVGIAEGYATTFCAGLALANKKPYFAVYSTFMQRALDNIAHDVCISSLPVVICLDRSGFVAYDGETHQGIYDISLLSCLPNINIICPKDKNQLFKMLDFSVNFDKPLVIRYPKGYIDTLYNDAQSDFTLGKWENLTNNSSNFYILACGGIIVDNAIKAKEILNSQGIEINVINACSIKPLDTQMLDLLKDKTLLTLEDNVLQGGFGSIVSEYYKSKNISVSLYSKGAQDTTYCQASLNELLEIAELDSKHIADFIKSII